MIDKQKKEQIRNLRMYVRSIGIGAEPTDFFSQNEMVFIYGCGDIGRALYYKIRDCVKFIGFIDKNISYNPYSQEKVFSLGGNDVKRYRDEELTIIVTPTAFFNDIKSELECAFAAANIYSIVDLFAVINAQVILHKKSRDCVVKYIKGNAETLRYNIAVVGTDYGLLVYLLYMKMRVENTIFILGSYDRFCDYRISRLEKYACGCIYNMFHEGYLELKNGPEFDIIRAIQKQSLLREDHVFAHDLLPISLEFIDNHTTYIDDGLPSHIAPEEAVVKSYVYLKHESKIILGKSNSVVNEHKKLEIDLKNEWDSLSFLKQQQLLDIFGARDDIAFLRANPNKYLFLTSAYSEAGLMSKDNEIRICKQLMSEYNENEVVIKPHPVDSINYKELFPDSIVISAHFPFELLWLIGIKIKCVLHFGTSAATKLFNDKFPEKNYSFLLGDMKLDYSAMLEYNDPESYLSKF